MVVMYKSVDNTQKRWSSEENGNGLWKGI